MMRLFNFWYEFPMLARVGFSLALIFFSMMMYFVDGEIFLKTGIPGFVFLLFSGGGGKSKGYNF